MSPRVVMLSLASVLAAAGTASAQAPGEWSAAPPSTYYAPPPPVVVAPPPPPERRWSIGLSLGQLELSPPDLPDERQTYNLGQIAVRYRPWRRLELELSLGGGHEYYEGGAEGDRAVATGTLAARYRFNPQNKWNWWLLAGLGQTTIERRDATDEQIEAAARPHGTIGAGIERRFHRFALQFELRAIAVGQTEEEMELSEAGAMVGQGLTGGNFAFGASYYF